MGDAQTRKALKRLENHRKTSHTIAQPVPIKPITQPAPIKPIFPQSPRAQRLDLIFQVSCFVDDLEELKKGVFCSSGNIPSNETLDLAELKMAEFNKEEYLKLCREASEEFTDWLYGEDVIEGDETNQTVRIVTPIIEYLESLTIPSFREMAFAEGFTEEEVAQHERGEPMT